ncbi:MAG: hypothetical protein M1834_007538 [Cirrosporium novae-zelandiae]|nr:MAG: hypothetical protein M1834_007538 [Cirrosporium novae-zelandiae]
MAKTLLPRFLMPDFTWPLRKPVPLVPEIPPTPKPTYSVVQRFWGFVHWYLQTISMKYCDWFGIPYNNQINQLPFGLILKWSDGTRLEEVLATKAMYKAGFPVPRIITYGSHPDSPHAPMSILMTRIPGQQLGQVYKTMNSTDKETVRSEMKTYLDTMRKWKSPWGGNRICSISGTAIRSVRVPNHRVGPCENQQELFNYLISPAWASRFKSKAKYQELLAKAKQISSIQAHKIVFTHGDLKHHNILVDKGHVTGFIDWESAGWYPDYWDFTTGMRVSRKGSWWHDFVITLGGDKYPGEFEADRALNSLTVESYAW